MEFSEILQAITTVGFPIVCCGAMMWYVKYTNDRNSDEINHLTEEHRSEISEVTQALNNNTLVIQKLCDILTKGSISVD